MQDYFKKDLLKIIILAVTVIAVLAALAIWDSHTGILENFSSRYF